MQVVDKFDKVLKLSGFHVGELVTLVAGEKDEVKVLDYLKRFNALSPKHSMAVKMILRGIYDNEITLDLPEGMPTIRREFQTEQDAPANLIRVSTELALFANGSNRKIQNKIQRQQRFIQFVESFSAPEIDVILAIKDKKPLKGVTSSFLVKNFPGLLVDPIADAVVASESPKVAMIIETLPKPLVKPVAPVKKPAAKPIAKPRASPKATPKKAG